MLLGLAPQDIASPTGDHNDEHEEQTTELIGRLDFAATIDPTTVMILRTDTNNLRYLDRKLGGPAIADKMRAQIAQIERAHSHAVRPGIRAQLAHLLAETASLAGWQAINTLALNDAWTHYEHAKAAAYEAEDPAVLAYVSGEQAYVLMDSADPPKLPNSSNTSTPNTAITYRPACAPGSQPPRQKPPPSSATKPPAAQPSTKPPPSSPKATATRTCPTCSSTPTT
ncbi:hypothetical protein [Nonomuraea sp. CA-141351]|uniref:hypothetical protein n=1 Tax=Nonomuraea sp. CA-141351 TaxID=3239996 RepID=UPI003D8BBA63